MDANNETDRAKLRASVKAMIDSTDWLSLAELYAHRAKHFRMKYNALIKEGFAPEQALYLTEKWV